MLSLTFAASNIANAHLVYIVDMKRLLQNINWKAVLKLVNSNTISDVFIRSNGPRHSNKKKTIKAKQETCIIIIQICLTHCPDDKQ